MSAALKFQEFPAPANPNLVSESDLKTWLGYEQTSAVERWLIDRGIPFDKARGHIVTTLAAINGALVGIKQESSGFEFR